MALFGKWGWKAMSAKDSLIFSILESKYGSFVDCCERYVGNGMDTRFWLDKWVDGTSLKDRFPRLFQIENNPFCKVADSNLDVWRWKSNSNGYYTVKTAYATISKQQSEDSSTSLKLGEVWNKAVPIKIAAFSWKALQDRIPTILNLRKRGSYNPHFSTMCRLCNLAPEDYEHLLFDCKTALSIWRCIFRWVGSNGQISVRGHS
ncbi:hypothetical protein ACS0TY_034759 [Phlomoides rotata]